MSHAQEHTEATEATEATGWAGSTAATLGAAVMFAGGALVAFPQHALSIVQVLALTAAVVAGIQVLNSTVTWRRVHGLYDRWTHLMSPFRQAGAAEKRRGDLPELERVTAVLARSRSRSSSIPPIPPELVLRLGRIARAELLRQGVDPHDPAQQATYRRALSTDTWQVLLYNPKDPKQQDQIQRQPQKYAAPDPTGTAAIVHAVLDDLDRFRDGSRPTDPPAAQTRPTRGT